MERPEDILDNEEKIGQIDPKNMLGLVDKLPDMIGEGWLAAEALKPAASERLENIVISGMGGSAISGDIAASVLKDKLDIPIVVNRSYKAPKFTGKGTLFIALSYSGNTEETISSYKSAIQNKARIISISSGGLLKDLAAKNGHPHVEIPGGLPPRSALGYLLGPLLNVLSKHGLAEGIKEELDQAVRSLKQFSKKRTFSSALRDNDAKQLAIKLQGKVPVIIASEGTSYAAALRWKTQFNENSKATALLAVFPELNHNDMVNFASLRNGQHNYQFILLRDEGDIERMKKRIEITKSLISGSVGGITEIQAAGRSPIERTLSLISLGDYVSVYLGIINGIDPTPVDIIERLKKELDR